MFEDVFEVTTLFISGTPWPSTPITFNGWFSLVLFLFLCSLCPYHVFLREKRLMYRTGGGESLFFYKACKTWGLENSYVKETSIWHSITSALLGEQNIYNIFTQYPWVFPISFLKHVDVSSQHLLFKQFYLEQQLLNFTAKQNLNLISWILYFSSPWKFQIMLFFFTKKEITNETDIKQKGDACMHWECMRRTADPMRQRNVILIHAIHLVTPPSYLWLPCHLLRKLFSNILA